MVGVESLTNEDANVTGRVHPPLREKSPEKPSWACCDRWSRILVGLIFAAVYIWVLYPIARFYWFIPAGWRFAALVLLPWRYWPWILGGEAASRFVCAVVPWHDPDLGGTVLSRLTDPVALALTFAAPLGAMPGLILLRWRDRAANLIATLDTTRGMGWLLIFALISAAGEMSGNLLYLHVGHVNPGAELGMGYLRFVLGNMTGDYIGVIMLAPTLLALFSANKFRHELHLVPDALLLLAFALFYLAAMRSRFDPMVNDYARILVLIPAFVSAFRHGWRGGAVALTICSLLVALVPAPLIADPYRNLFTQMLLALSGSAALLLGSAIDAQARSRAELTRQNAELEVANAGLDRLGVELREAAQRNLRLEEEQRRRIAAEIHDELGQNLTAVHTHVKLAANRLNAAQVGDVTTSIYDLLATMRRSVRGLMDSLRPPILDEFGLVRALREGPLRGLVEHAGMQYEFTLLGEPALIAALDDDTQIAIWRIVQEAATNTVRHAQAKRFRARLRVGARGMHVLLVLDLRDDGIGVGVAPHGKQRSYGLQGMHDRVLALDGRMHLRGDANGTRLHVLLRQPM